MYTEDEKISSPWIFIPTTYISELALRKYIPGCGEERSINNMTNKWNQLVDRINHAAGRRAMVEDQVGRPRLWSKGLGMY